MKYTKTIEVEVQKEYEDGTVVLYDEKENKHYYVNKEAFKEEYKPVKETKRGK